MKKIILSLILILILTQTINAETNTITINSSGNYASNAITCTSESGRVNCVFSTNVSGNIEIKINNVTLNCENNKLTGGVKNYGKNTEIINCKINNTNDAGIFNAENATIKTIKENIIEGKTGISNEGNITNIIGNTEIKGTTGDGIGNYKQGKIETISKNRIISRSTKNNDAGIYNDAQATITTIQENSIYGTIEILNNGTITNNHQETETISIKGDWVNESETIVLDPDAFGWNPNFGNSDEIECSCEHRVFICTFWKCTLNKNLSINLENDKYGIIFDDSGDKFEFDCGDDKKTIKLITDKEGAVIFNKEPENTIIKNCNIIIQNKSNGEVTGILNPQSTDEPKKLSIENVSILGGENGKTNGITNKGYVEEIKDSLIKVNNNSIQNTGTIDSIQNNTFIGKQFTETEKRTIINNNNAKIKIFKDNVIKTDFGLSFQVINKEPKTNNNNSCVGWKFKETNPQICENLPDKKNFKPLINVTVKKNDEEINKSDIVLNDGEELTLTINNPNYSVSGDEEFTIKINDDILNSNGSEIKFRSFPITLNHIKKEHFKNNGLSVVVVSNYGFEFEPVNLSLETEVVVNDFDDGGDSPLNSSHFIGGSVGGGSSSSGSGVLVAEIPFDVKDYSSVCSCFDLKSCLACVDKKIVSVFEGG